MLCAQNTVRATKKQLQEPNALFGTRDAEADAYFQEVWHETKAEHKNITNEA